MLYLHTVFTYAALVHWFPATGLQRESAVRGRDYGPCGVVSLFLVCQYRDLVVGWEEMTTLVGPPSAEKTHTFEALSNAARKVGLRPVGLETTARGLQDLPMPAIVQFTNPQTEMQHLVVLLSAQPDRFHIVDAPHAAFHLKREQLELFWTGNVLVFPRTEEEERRLRASFSPESAVNTGIWGRAGCCLLFVSLLFLGLRYWVWRIVLGVKSFAAVAVRFSTLANIAYLALGLAVCLAAALYFFGSRSGKAGASGPQLAIENPVQELGEFEAGTHQATFLLSNPGTSALEIQQIRSTCSCAVPEMVTSLAPGETKPLQVKLIVTAGPKKVALHIDSNAATAPPTLELSWQGLGSLSLSQSIIRAPSAPVEKPYERTISLYFPAGKRAVIPELERVTCACQNVAIRQGKVHNSASGSLSATQLAERDLHITVSPPSSPGVVDAQCALHIKQGKSSVPLYLLIHVPFVSSRITPKAFSAGFSAGKRKDLVGQEVSIPCELSSPKDELQLNDLPSWLAGNVEKTGQTSRLIRLKVVGAPATRFGRHTIQLGLAREPNIRVPLKVYWFASDGS